MILNAKSILLQQIMNILNQIVFTNYCFFQTLDFIFIIPFKRFKFLLMLFFKFFCKVFKLEFDSLDHFFDFLLSISYITDTCLYFLYLFIPLSHFLCGLIHLLSYCLTQLLHVIIGYLCNIFIHQLKLPFHYLTLIRFFRLFKHLLLPSYTLIQFLLHLLSYLSILLPLSLFLSLVPQLHSIYDLTWPVVIRVRQA